MNATFNLVTNESYKVYQASHRGVDFEVVIDPLSRVSARVLNAGYDSSEAMRNAVVADPTIFEELVGAIETSFDCQLAGKYSIGEWMTKTDGRGNVWFTKKAAADDKK